MTTVSALQFSVYPFPVGAGVTDHLAESEPHAISIARNILENLNMAAAAGTSTSSSPSQLANAMAHTGQVMQRAAGSLPGPAPTLAPAWEEPLFPAEELRGADHQSRLACYLAVACVTPLHVYQPLHA